ncbi:MAG: CDP-glycerol glycerophosphotransferase family protein [Lachnoclostridium sp.]|jgi:CDP-glycerol glycerophosphotransferase (TagB/SpsB family)|nr:CDP-glycerol glycerophosphotransferase family protein [Lachnoclostridium sp.]
MNDGQKEILSTLRTLGNRIRDGIITFDDVPDDVIREVILTAFRLDKNDELLSNMADLVLAILSKSKSHKDISLYANVIYFIADSMNLLFDSKSIIGNLNHAIAIKNHRNSLFEEIVDKFVNDDIDDEYISQRSYQYLVSVKMINRNKLFQKIALKVYETNIESIRKKSRITVAFLIHDSAMWSCESIYQKLCDHALFDPYIAVTPFTLGTLQISKDTYYSCIKYFTDRNYKTKGMYDFDQKKLYTWEELGLPDIVFHIYPHHKSFVDTANIENFPLSILNIEVPYSVTTASDINQQFNQMSHSLFWKIFDVGPFQTQLHKKYSDVGDFNLVESGYVKMDDYFSDRAVDEKSIWKVGKEANRENVKKIIYAPHWSIRNAYTGYGNFDKIYKEIYEYAKSHKDTTSWIFRPHPVLRYGCIQQGLFQTEKEYANYLAMWDALPNASVSTSGTYIDLFKTSDALILDSGSFMSEYLFVGKPMLFLTRDTQKFNDYGNELMKILYKTDGGNFRGIEEFIENVVKNNDPMKKERNAFFEKYLNYMNFNGKLASDYIFDYLMKIFM